MSDQFVRVIDPQTGYQRTAHVSEVETNKALKVLSDHDAVDVNGVPLPPKFNEPKGSQPNEAGESGKGASK